MAEDEKDKDSGKDSGKDSSKEKRKAPPPTKKGTFFKNLLFVSLLGLVVIGGLAYLSFDPQDLSDIEGYQKDRNDSPLPLLGGRNLGTVLENAAKNKHGVRITEEEINNYIRRTLKFEQEGWFKSFVTARGAWIKLEEGVIEVIIEREITWWDKRHTVSMLLFPRQTKDEDGNVSTQLLNKKRTGRWGRTRVMNGFVWLIGPSFTALREAYAEETKQVWDMFRGRFQIKVSDGVMELSPPEEPPLRKTDGSLSVRFAE
jgi:hypothetical protein